MAPMFGRLVLLPFLIGLSWPRSATQPPSRGALVVRLGRVSLAVERLTRTADRMEGDLVRQQPVTSMWHYRLDFEPGGRAARFELRLVKSFGPPQPQALKSATFAVTGDTVRLELARDTTIRRSIRATNVSPGFPEFSAFAELWPLVL